MDLGEYVLKKQTKDDREKLLDVKIVGFSFQNGGKILHKH